MNYVQLRHKTKNGGYGRVISYREPTERLGFRYIG